MKTYYYLYQITNLVNAKIYVGVHKTNNLDDGYMGSGKVIQAAIKKHGIINFQKDILEFFDNPKDMYAREKEVVTADFLLREDVYNLRRGGHGGFDYINRIGLNTAGHFKSYEFRVNKLRENYKKLLEQGHHIKNYQMPGFKSESHKQKMSDLSRTPEANAKRILTMKSNGHSQGTKNSQYGTIWITNGKQNLKIKKSENIPDGFVKGRTIKYK